MVSEILEGFRAPSVSRETPPDFFVPSVGTIFWQTVAINLETGYNEVYPPNAGNLRQNRGSS